MRILEKALNIVMLVGVISVGVLFVCQNMFMPWGMTCRIVTSGSMEPSIHTGSLLYIDEGVSGEDIAPGDIAVFNIDETYGQICAHRVIENDAQTKTIRTKGDANDVEDPLATSYDSIVGRGMISIPYLGYAVNALSENKIIVCSLLVSLVCSAHLLRRVSSDGSGNSKEERMTAYARTTDDGWIAKQR